MKPDGLCIIGKTETENIGIDKIIRNTVANPAIRFLIISGRDPDGHRSGATITAIAKHGVDTKMRIIGSPGKRPVIVNATPDEIEIFRKQVEVIDMIGCEGTGEIISKIAALAARQVAPFVRGRVTKKVPVPEVLAVAETPTNEVTLDRAGYFVVIPEYDKNDIVVEHYGYDNRLLNVIKGNMPAICRAQSSKTAG